MFDNRVIAVSQRIDWIDHRNETRDALDQRLVEWLLEANMRILPVPNLINKHELLFDWLKGFLPQAILLSGGNDIGEYTDRDKTEGSLINYAEANRLPLLGICRGMQMMAHQAGVSLEKVNAHAGTRHRLHPVSEKVIFPDEVNSFHDWRLSECPVEYEVMATAADGTIEAIRHKKYAWEGWMWHPERESSLDGLYLERFKQILKIK